MKGKTIFIFGGIAIALYFASKTRAAATLSNAVLSKLYQAYKWMAPEQLQRAISVIREVKRANIPAAAVPFVVAQLAAESQHFKSQLAIQQNNFGGIKFMGQPGAAAGTITAPAGEENGYRRPYAQYPTISAFLKDYFRILNTVGTARPLQQTTPEGYAHALKVNRYYQAPENDYSALIKNLSLVYTPIISAI